ncbi:MAG: M28 family metallopeptidase [Flavobacteriaceae bacterium]
MKYYLPLFLSLLFLSCQNNSSKTKFDFTLDGVKKQISLEETKRLLFTLAADSMKGRDSKNGGYAKAATFVASYFKEHQIKPFYPAYRDSLEAEGHSSYNLVGQVGAYDPNKKTILIGAHLDHIGIGGKALDSIFNGANDNATGSTAVLQIGRFLAQHQWNQNVVLGLFADEEKGLLGAYHLAEHFKNEGVKIDYMINFEMIGKILTTGANQVYMTGYERSNMADVLHTITPNFVQFLPEAKAYNLFQRSDNYAFYNVMGIPAHTLSSFDFKNYDYYHKVEDEADKMDVENMHQIIATATYAITQLLAQENEILLLSTEEEN